MKQLKKLKTILCLLTGLMLGSAPVLAGTLTPAEVTQIEGAFGITLTTQEKTDLGAIVKPDTSPAWRTAADARIDLHRKATLNVQVVDSVGTPVPSAGIAVKLNKNAFKFGGVVTVMDLTDADGNLSDEGSTTNDWKQITTNLFNSMGFNNGFKPKITGQHQYIPNFMSWAGANKIDMRGHLLMWPGGTHFSTASTSAYATHNIQGALDTYNASSQTQIDKDELEAEADAEILEWVEQWDVYEWDVINETIGNHVLQDILGYDQMAEWFKIAENNKVSANTGLYINEFKIISAKPVSLDGGTHYTSRKGSYTSRIDDVISDGGPITGIGFQSRFKYGPVSLDEVYSRLDDFATLYPNLTLAGTEFEMKDGTDYTYTEYERAQMTEELLTTYYSHDQVIGLNAWDIMNSSTGLAEDKARSMTWYDGTIKLNGLVWYYLHRIRYVTETNDTTDLSGNAPVVAYKGDYDIIVSYDGTDYPATATLSSNQTVVVTLGDVTLIPSPNAPVFTVDPITKPNADESVAYTGQSITNSATDADGDTLTYSKIAGPAWLTINSNGDLSGTPSNADAGQNSWIIEVSDGFNTDIATLKISVNGSGGGGPGANISIISQSDNAFNVTGGASGTSSFTGISAQVGDVIVLTLAGNKKGSVISFSTTQVGGTGSVGTQTELTNALTTYPTSWAWYYTVTTAGTFDFDITTDNTAGITAITSIYVLRANSGTVELADFATWDDTEGNANPATHTLNYSFSSSLPDGVLIECISARHDDATGPVAYTIDRSAGTAPKKQRSLISYDGVTGSSWSSDYVLTLGDVGKLTSGAVGMVFVEITSGGGNTPPTFDSDPVSGVGATQDSAYTGSSLADNASDGDSDPMTFEKVSGPSWLNVATNGALTGTPLVGDLGSNGWKVLVTDGTATNFATLAINVSASLPPAVTPQNGTNILFIAIDDMNPILGCYGNDKIISPQMDALAASGVTFLNAHAQWSVCGPSRASLTTSLMPEEMVNGGFDKMRGDADNSSRVNDIKRPNVVTLQQYFRYNGYRTAATGKINDNRCVGSMNTITKKVAEDGSDVDDPPSWGEPVDPNNLPADFFSNSSYVKAASGWSPVDKPAVASANLPDSDFTDGKICDEGITLIQSLAAGDTQFFLGVGFKKPHLGFYAPLQYFDLYTQTNFAVASFQDHPLHEVSYTWNYAAELESYDDFNPASPNYEMPATNVTVAKQQELLQGYYACISYIDVQVGRLLAELDAQGLSSNTIVVLWGDHGFQLGEHAEWAKHTNLERATRVPLIIRNPFDGQAGVSTGTPAALMDLYPTLCEMAGLPIPEQPLAENEDPFTPASGRALKGISLAGVVNGTEATVRTGAVNLFTRSGRNGYAYRTDRYRYTEWVNKTTGVVDARELYDYQLDPEETVNLAGEAGFDALMYQFSKSMRKEFDDMALDPSDQAAPKLQDSPIEDTMNGNNVLPGLDGSVIGTDVHLDWPVAVGSIYNVLMKTNLLDATWSTNQSDVVGSLVQFPADMQQGFFQVEVSN